MACIRTVVFDMGGVLMEWNPLKLARAFTQSDADAELIAREVYGGPEWLLQDAGAVSSSTVAWAAQRRLPERLEDAAAEAAQHWYEHRTMLPHIGDLIRALKQEGYGIYLLSNAGVQFAKYRHSLPAIECFDGEVVSAFEHVVKPDLGIFQILCERYGLTPDECLFVDDTEVNVAAAERAGMHGYLHGGDVEALERYVRSFDGPAGE